MENNSEVKAGGLAAESRGVWKSVRKGISDFAR